MYRASTSILYIRRKLLSRYLWQFFKAIYFESLIIRNLLFTAWHFNIVHYELITNTMCQWHRPNWSECWKATLIKINQKRHSFFKKNNCILSSIWFLLSLKIQSENDEMRDTEDGFYFNSNAFWFFWRDQWLGVS